MPLYSLLDKNTGEETEVSMKIAELEEFLKENPHVEQIFTHGLFYGDPVLQGTVRPPQDYKDLLKHMKGKMPGNKINDM